MSTPLQNEMDDAIAAVLGDMQHAAGELEQVLEAERAALDTTNCEALDQAGARKQAVMAQLEQLDTERQLLCRELPALSGDPEKTWAGIVESLRQCHRLNQRNGGAVAQRLILVRQALSVLTGHAGETELYGRSGELHASVRSQPLAAA